MISSLGTIWNLRTMSIQISTAAKGYSYNSIIWTGLNKLLLVKCRLEQAWMLHSWCLDLEAVGGDSGSRWRGGGLLVPLLFDGNRLTPKQCRDGGGPGQSAQHVLYQLQQRQHGSLQPFLLWFIVCRTNVNCFHHWQLCERLDVPSLSPCLPLNVCLCPYAIPTMPASLLTPPSAHLSLVRQSLF